MSEVELSEPLRGGYSVTLPSFEGPLDLLLHLCQKHELDILDIPIGFVTEKYLEYLAVMQLMDLDVASEYLVMAATLAHIKSKMLLPAPPPGQEDEVSAEEEDPREALIRRLLEYQKYKQAGEELTARGVAGRDVFMRGMPIEEAVHTGLPPLAQVPLFSLVEAFQTVLSKSKVKLSHDIVHERITLTDRINELVDLLRVHRRLAFEELFVHVQAVTRFDLVITFLALLEMTRLRMTRLFQADFESKIYVEFTAQVSAEDASGALGALGSSVEVGPVPDDIASAASNDASAPSGDLPASGTDLGALDLSASDADASDPDEYAGAGPTDPPGPDDSSANDDADGSATDPPGPNDPSANDDADGSATDPPGPNDPSANDEEGSAFNTEPPTHEPVEIHTPSVTEGELVNVPLQTIPCPPPAPQGDLISPPDSELLARLGRSASSSSDTSSPASGTSVEAADDASMEASASPDASGDSSAPTNDDAVGELDSPTSTPSPPPSSDST